MKPSLTIEMQARLEEAIERALDKFWDSVGESFDEIGSGDFDPMYEGVMYQQATEWVEHWLSLNGKDIYV